MNNIAICYDFDGTLAPGNMQEHGLIADIGMSVKEYWRYTAKFTDTHSLDNVLSYMKTLVDVATDADKLHLLTRKSLGEYGSKIPCYKGVKEWFGNMNTLGAELGLNVEHYIISSGLREMLEGTPIAGEFKGIYASYYMYDDRGYPVWPANTVNFTMKTQYLYRIHKGIFDIMDNHSINAAIPDDKRRVPFTNMIYIGDGSTDIPCMEVVKHNGGLSIGIFDNSKGNDICSNMMADGRIHKFCKANYRVGKELYNIVADKMQEIASRSNEDSMCEYSQEL